FRSRPGVSSGVDSARLTRRALLQRGAAAGVALSVPRWILAPANAVAAAAPRPLTLGPANDLVELPSAVFGGELQYFRMSGAALPARLHLCLEAAFTVIQTHVPCNVHEFVSGQPDFSGRTQPVLPDDHLDEYTNQTPDEELQ